MSEQEPESDYTTVSVPDDDLPDDLQPGDDNPLAEPPSEEAERQDMGDPHMPGLERDSDDALTLPDDDGDRDGDRDGDGDGED